MKIHIKSSITKDKDMAIRYFLQVCRDKLTDYIMKAIICPDDSMGDECHIDTQSIYPNILLLSNSIIKDLEHYEEVLLEVILTKDELKNELKNSNIDGVFYIEKPLPISRIKKIYVQNEKEKEHILRKIDTNQKGFIPESLIEINHFEDKYELPIITMEIKEYKKELNQFDKLLGMLSYMKNCEYYYVDKNKSFINYSSDYFSVVNKFNSFSDISTSDFLDDLKKGSIQDKFLKFIIQNKRLDKNFIQTLIDEEADKDIKQNLISLISDPLNKLEVLKYMQNKGIYFHICMVYINGDKYSNKITNLKSLLNKQVPYQMVQETLAYLGLYYGYQILDSNEEITIKDRYLKTFLKNNQLNTKFLLNTRFDYFVIESVYKYVFNNKNIKDEFTYLDDIQVLLEDDNIKIDDNYEKKVLNKCCDVEQFEIKKRSSSELINYKLNKYDDKIYADKYIFVCYNKYYTEKKDEIPVEKEILLAKIKENKMTKIREKEFLSAIKMDGL